MNRPPPPPAENWKAAVGDSRGRIEEVAAACAAEGSVPVVEGSALKVVEKPVGVRGTLYAGWTSVSGSEVAAAVGD